MNRKRIVAIVVLAALALLPLHFSHAGGWASVEIVKGPDELEAGKPMTFQLAIKGHGISPVDIDPLVIQATNEATSETVEETASKASGLGNYSVEITFPSDGIWDLEGRPGGFQQFDMGPINVGQSPKGSALIATAGAVTIGITGGMGSGAFAQGSVEVSAGTLVVWTNDSTEGHSIVIEGAMLSSGLIAPGGAYALLFEKPGKYHYVCGPHPNMSGDIVVS